MSYDQPLLRGAGRLVNESQIVLAQIDARASERQLMADLQDYLIQVIQAYWELYLQRGTLVQTQQSLQRATHTSRQLETRRSVDASPDQVIRAEAAFASRRSAVVIARNAVVNLQDQLLSLVYGPQFQELAEAELIPMTPIKIRVCPIDLQREVHLAMLHRSELAVTLAAVQAAGIRKEVARNELLPASISSWRPMSLDSKAIRMWVGHGRISSTRENLVIPLDLSSRFPSVIGSPSIAISVVTWSCASCKTSSNSRLAM